MMQAGCNVPDLLARRMTTKRLWAGWKYIARKIGNFQARVILTVFYFTIALPFGTGARWLADPLHLKRRAAPSGWRAREVRAPDLTELRRQY